METLIRDIRYGVRMLLKSPGFTAAAILALALGIGGNTAIFSVVNAVLLHPLPYKDPALLVQVKQQERRSGSVQDTVSGPNFIDWRDQNQVFDHLGAYRYMLFGLVGGGQPETVVGLLVSYAVLPALGVQPMLGRTFLPEEDQPGRNLVVILSHGLWQRRFGSDPGLIGKTITIDNENRTVVGIMPPGFNFPPTIPTTAAFPSRQMALWAPLWDDPKQLARDENTFWLVGRLKAHIPIEQAQQDMSNIARRLEQQYPKTNSRVGVKVSRLQEQVLGDVRPALLILLGAIGLVLLIACANVANLLLARAVARYRETAIRQALGAGRIRLIRQFLTESVLLALLGGATGLLLAVWGISVLVALGPQTIPRLTETVIDNRVLGFTFALAFLTGIISGMAPALQASRAELNQTLKEGGTRSTTGDHGKHVRSLLVVSEIALALVLSVGACLLIRSFLHLQQVDPGFQPEKVLTLSMLVDQSKYRKPHQWPGFYQQVLERVETLPGVQAAGLVNALPMGGTNANSNFTIEGRPVGASGEPSAHADYRVISPNYFHAMGIPLLRGRAFTGYDKEESPALAIINEAAAKRYWPNEDPLGKRLSVSDENGRPHWRQIVGVVRNVKHQGLAGPLEPEIYVPYFHEPYPFMVLAVRTASDPNSLITAVQSQIWMVDKDQPVFLIRTMRQLVSDSISEWRFQMVLLGIFGALALILAAIGIYGVMSYAVTQRTHEMGVRIALGAHRRDILKLVVGQALRWLLAGVAIGLTGAFALTRVMSSLLYEVTPTDPVTFVGVSLVLAGIAVLASYLPAQKATRVDPMVALRCE
jgi:putative ABC transport system permease protein